MINTLKMRKKNLERKRDILKSHLHQTELEISKTQWEIMKAEDKESEHREVN